MDVSRVAGIAMSDTIGHRAQVSAISTLSSGTEGSAVLTRMVPTDSVKIAMGKVSKWLGRTHGAVSTEYVIVVGAVGLLFVAALVAVGPGLVESYEITRSVIASPFP